MPAKSRPSWRVLPPWPVSWQPRPSPTADGITLPRLPPWSSSWRRPTRRLLLRVAHPHHLAVVPTATSPAPRHSNSCSSLHPAPTSLRSWATRRRKMVRRPGSRASPSMMPCKKNRRRHHRPSSHLAPIAAPMLNWNTKTRKSARSGPLPLLLTSASVTRTPPPSSVSSSGRRPSGRNPTPPLRPLPIIRHRLGHPICCQPLPSAFGTFVPDRRMRMTTRAGMLRGRPTCRPVRPSLAYPRWPFPPECRRKI
mmetsp:Transcript_16787/g.48225  ORF Transcript_16787/g.48225 Transcript_16787/m.48225 type:complete len:252 (+) Transcript_16787:2225-2980(+)